MNCVDLTTESASEELEDALDQLQRVDAELQEVIRVLYLLL